MAFPYLATATLDNGEERVLDLEQHGWADKEMLARTVRFALVPKDGEKTMKDSLFPLVMVKIPDGAKPIFKSRVFRNTLSDDLEFRVFCIGFKKGRTHSLIWVLPTGDIEFGQDDETIFGQILLNHMVAETKRLMKEQEEREQALTQ